MRELLEPFDEPWLRLAAGVITGVILGSFVTMLSYRLPRRLSIIAPGSHCPACKTRLKPIDLVPLLSWAWQRGKCRHCGVFIGWRYPVIETVMGGASAVAFLAIGLTPVLPAVLALALTLMAIVVMRLEC